MRVSPFLRRLTAPGLLVVGLMPSLGLAQSSIRCWGENGYDTDSRQRVFLQVDAAMYQTAVLRADGRVFVNGNNDWGMLVVPAAPPGLSYTHFGISNIGGAAVLTDGSIAVWGLDTGNIVGTWFATTLPPAPSLPPGMRYERVAVAAHVLALRSDGNIVAWGNNQYGQCNVPPLPAGTTVVELRAEARSSYAILSDGSILAWGASPFGGIPPLPAGLGYRDIRQSITHCVAVRSDGQLVAWGTNQYGQLNVPPLPPGTTYVLAAAGDGHTQAVRSDGVLVAWGENSMGQCNVPQLPAGVHCVQIDCGQHHTVGLLSTGKVITWGNFNSFDNSFVPALPEPTAAAPSPEYVDLARGYEHTVAVTSTGEIVAWGNNNATQCTFPASLHGASITKLDTQTYHCGALLRNGSLVCWGDNSVGQCSVPTLPAGVRYTDFSIGVGHTLAIRSDGVAVGFGTLVTNPPYIPPLPAGVQYVQADSEYDKGVLLRSDGTIVSWGVAPAMQHVVPPPPPGLAYVDLAASQFHTAALLSDGTVTVWGSMSWTSPVWRPFPVLPWGLYYVEVDGGYQHTAMRRSDGQVIVAGVCGSLEDQVPALGPDTSYVQISANGGTTAARVGPTSTYVGVAQGCGGSMPARRLVPRDTPRIGAPLQVTLFDLPANLALLAMSLQLPNGVPLAPLGMPGCTWHVPLDAVVLLAGQNNQAKFVLPLPNSPQLVGTHFFHQALVLDPAAGNGFGAVVSDAAEGVIGR